MVKNFLSSIILLVVAVAVIASPVNRVCAQEARSIIPRPRDITIEAVDPVTRMPQSSFCIGIDTIDVKLTNNSGYRKYVAVLNRDTRGVERTLYNGWLEPGTHYLSRLLRTQLELTGPAGTEMLRVDVREYGQSVEGRWVSFYVQDCGGPGPGPGPGGHAQLWAWISPYAIEQGKKGTITLQTSVGVQPNVAYYFEILNSWEQLWKRLPVSKRPYERYQLKLAVGKKTKPGILTYTVKLWQESGVTGERWNIAVTHFSFRVITPGSAPSPYDPGYWPPYYSPGYQYPGTPGWDPYGSTPYSGSPGTSFPPPSDMESPHGMGGYQSPAPYPGYGYPGYMSDPYGMSSGYKGYDVSPQSERQID